MRQGKMIVNDGGNDVKGGSCGLFYILSQPTGTEEIQKILRL